LKEKLDGLRIGRARATDGIETSKETLKQLRSESAEANRDQTKIQKETDGLAREREKVDARVAELDEQIKAADKDLHDVDELASKSDAKVLGIQKEIIALNNEIDQVEERVKGIVLEGDRTKESAAPWRSSPTARRSTQRRSSPRRARGCRHSSSRTTRSPRNASTT